MKWEKTLLLERSNWIKKMILLPQYSLFQPSLTESSRKKFARLWSTMDYTEWTLLFAGLACFSVPHWHSHSYLRSQALAGWLRDTHDIFKETKSVPTFIERLECSRTARIFLPHPRLIKYHVSARMTNSAKDAPSRCTGIGCLFDWALGCCI
jgi:hypothetical protein